MAAKNETATDVRTKDRDGASTEIPEEHRVTRYGGGYYGRPQWVVRYYSNSINARAHVTCETRHEAIGIIPLVKRTDGAEDISLEYRAEYDHTPSKHYK